MALKLVTVTRTYTKSTTIEMEVEDGLLDEQLITFTDEQESEIEDGLFAVSLNWDGNDEIEVSPLN